MFKGFASKGIIEHEVHEVSSGVIYENEGFMLIAEPLKHSTECVGYSFIEKDRLRINIPAAKKLGLIEGPILGELQQGKSVIFKGKKIKPEEVAYVVKGRKVSYIADTVNCDGANKLAKEADLLISEGTHLSEIEDKAEKYMHLTVKDAALIASENNAKRLVITHISQRYKSMIEIIEEARNYFDNTIVAEDFMKIRV